MDIQLKDLRPARSPSKRSDYSGAFVPTLVVGHLSEQPFARDSSDTFQFARNRTARFSLVERFSGPFHGTVFVGGRPFQFTLNGIGEDDRIRADIYSSRRVHISVFHASGKKPDCFAQCPDGTRGSPCVDCNLENSRRIRICC